MAGDDADVFSLEAHRRGPSPNDGHPVHQELDELEELLAALQGWDLYGLELEAREKVIANTVPEAEVRKALAVRRRYAVFRARLERGAELAADDRCERSGWRGPPWPC